MSTDTQKPTMNTRMSTSQIWGMPMVIGMLSAIGLLSALLGDGIWDVLSWAALATPVAVTLWHVGHAFGVPVSREAYLVSRSVRTDR
jgi:hypothetical protein